MCLETLGKGHFRGLEIQQNAVKHSVLQKLLRLDSTANTSPQTAVSICCATRQHPGKGGGSLPMPQTSQPPPRCPGVALLQGNRQTLSS